MYGFSREKLISAINKSEKPQYATAVDSFKNSKKERIVTFLKGVMEDESLSEFDPVDANARRISNLVEKKDLWMLYCEMYCDETSGIPDYSYFVKIWKKETPNLCESLVFNIFLLLMTTIFLFLLGTVCHSDVVL